MSSQLRIELFGQLRVVHGDSVASHFATQKAAALLAYLAYHKEQNHSREYVASLLWPDSPPDAARGSLSTALWSLRNIVNPSGTPGDALLVSDRSSLSLRRDSVSTDVQDFETSLSQADQAVSCSERISLLEAGLAFYQAPLLSGDYGDWVALERERLDNLFVKGCKTLSQLYTSASELDNALAWAQKAVQCEPFQEDLHLNLMQILAAMGRPNEAILHYRDMERMFQEELSVSPSGEALLLLQSLRANLPAPAPKPYSAAEDALPLQNEPHLSLATIRASVRTPSNATKLLAYRSMRLIGAFGALTALILVLHAQFNVPRAKTARTYHPANSVKADPLRPQNQKTQPNNPAREDVPKPSVRTPVAPLQAITSAKSTNISKSLSAPAPEGRTLWAQHYACLPDEREADPVAIQTSMNGDLYVAGFVKTLHNDTDFLIVKYAPNGELIWRKRWNGAGNDCDRARSMALDSEGSAYVAGETYDGDVEQGRKGWETVLVKFSSKGEKQWEHYFNDGRTYDERTIGVSIDVLDRVYIRGCQGAHGSNARYALYKFDKNGAPLWRQPATYHPPDVGSDSADIGVEDMLLDANGNLIIAAQVTTAGRKAGGYWLLAKYDAEGSLLWMRRFSEEKRVGDLVRKISQDAVGNIVVAGIGFTFHNQTQKTVEGVFIARFNYRGDKLWQKYYADAFPLCVPDGLTTDAEGAIIATGTLGAPEQGYFVLKYTPSGELAWKRRYSAQGMYAGRIQGVVADSANNAYVISRSCDDSAPSAAQTPAGLVAIKYSPKGELLWQKSFGGISQDGIARAACIQKDGDGNIFIAGQAQIGDHQDLVIAKYSR